MQLDLIVVLSVVVRLAGLAAVDLVVADLAAVDPVADRSMDLVVVLDVVAVDPGAFVVADSCHPCPAFGRRPCLDCFGMESLDLSHLV